MKIVKGMAIILCIVVVGFFLGPQPRYGKFDSKIPTLNLSIAGLADYVSKRDRGVQHLKPNNESKLIWADSTQKTPYSLVYLHGFSASPMEGDPTHVDFAKRYGMNLYVPRLSGHGLDDVNSFEKLSPKALIDDAKEAIAIGQMIGEQVILMSCSTGSTLSIYLAATNPDKIHSMIMYSPNIRLHDKRSKLLAGPWGLQIVRKLVGERRRLTMIADTPLAQYTTVEYKVEGLVALQNLLKETMTPSIFEKVHAPFMAAYYYKNEEEFDGIISIDGIKEFAKAAATTEDKKRLVAMAEVKTHVIPSALYCKDMKTVTTETYQFAEEVLGLKQISENAEAISK